MGFWMSRGAWDVKLMALTQHMKMKAKNRISVSVRVSVPTKPQPRRRCILADVAGIKPDTR